MAGVGSCCRGDAGLGGDALSEHQRLCIRVLYSASAADYVDKGNWTTGWRSSAECEQGLYGGLLKLNSSF